MSAKSQAVLARIGNEIQMEPQVGDTVKCLPGFNISDSGDKRGGAGYRSGRVFTIQTKGIVQIEGDSVYWPRADGRDGVWSKAVVLVRKK